MDGLAARPAQVALLLIAAAGLTALFLARSAQASLVVFASAPALGAALVVALAAFACGSAAIAMLQLKVPRSPVALDEALLIGIAVFGTLSGAIAWIAVAPIPFMTVALAVAGLACLLLPKPRERLSLAAMTFREFNAIGVVLLAPPALLALAEALSPVSTPDELIYKLAVPHAYELAGRMIELPLNSNSYLAMSLHLADLAALMLGGGIAAKLLHFVIYLAALAALFRLARRYSARGAVAVVAVVAWTPALMMSAGWAFSEWCTLGLLVVSFERYQRWLDEESRANLHIAFAALGAAASVKYTALPWIAVFALLVLWRGRKRPSILIAAWAIALAFGVFFYARNAIWTGSPFAPLLLPDAPGVGNYRSGYRFSGWVDFFTGLDVYDPRIADESFGILLTAAMFASLIATNWRHRASRDLALLGLGQMVILLTIAPGSRNMINGTVALGITGAAAMVDIVAVSSRLVRVTAVAIAALAMVAHLGLAIVILSDRIPYLSGNETADAFLARTRTFTRPYSWIASNLPRDAKVLLLGETRSFYLERQSVNGGNLDGPRVANWLARLGTRDRLLEQMRREGITHVLLHPAWIRVRSSSAPDLGMLRNELALELEPPVQTMLLEFLRVHTVRRYGDGEYLIFELKR